jgi:microcin C transport system substrate-binding protein
LRIYSYARGELLRPFIDALGVVDDFRDGTVETEEAVGEIERVAGLGQRRRCQLAGDAGLGRLARLGIEVTVRIVDDVQYENRLRQWDFDAVVESWTETLSPGNELRDYWGSRAAVTPGSRNIIGIANKAVDSLIQQVVFAESREELIAATRALDRVLLWNHYVVPQWTYGKVRTARWDRFGKPDRMPIYGLSAFPTIWWWDTRRVIEAASRS